MARAMQKLSRPDLDADQVAAAEQQLVRHAQEMGPKDLRLVADRIVDAVDPDDLTDAALERDPAGHVADRPEPEHEEGPLGLRVGVGDGLPRGRQHVGEEQEAVVGRSLGHLDRPVVGLRDAQVLGLPAGDLAVELGVAQQ